MATPRVVKSYVVKHRHIVRITLAVLRTMVHFAFKDDSTFTLGFKEPLANGARCFGGVPLMTPLSTAPSALDPSHRSCGC